MFLNLHVVQLNTGLTDHQILSLKITFLNASMVFYTFASSIGGSAHFYNVCKG